MKVILVFEPGGPEALRLVDIPKPAPGPNQVVVKIAAIGVNFIDIYFRTGLYRAETPIAIGQEAAGTVEVVGADVTDFAALVRQQLFVYRDLWRWIDNSFEGPPQPITASVEQLAISW